MITIPLTRARAQANHRPRSWLDEPFPPLRWLYVVMDALVDVELPGHRRQVVLAVAHEMSAGYSHP